MYRIRVFLILVRIVICELGGMLADRRVRMLEIRFNRRQQRWIKIGKWFSKRVSNLEIRLTKF